LKKRHIVLALLCGVSAITFLDRLALPVAESGIRNDLHLSPERWGWILSSYVLANALFEIPSGALGDRHGRRRELTRIAAWWSAFTALTAWCRNFVQIMGARFLFGIGAAGAYPNAAGVVGRWFPRTEHARAQGFVWGAGRLGGALAPLLLVPLSRAYGWHSIFWMMGGVGFLWAALWWLLFRDDPESIADITQEELIEIGSSTVTAMDFDACSLHDESGAIPWASLLRLRHLWILTIAYFCYAWGSWFFFGWFTTWLTRGVGFTVTEMGLFASLPFLMGLAGNLIGGSASEQLVLRFGRRLTYRTVTCVCLVVASVLLLAMTATRSHIAIIALATAGFGIMDLMLPAAWAMSMSLGGRFGGTSSAMMNTAGNLGGWVCTVAFGYAIKVTGNYNFPLRAIAAMVLIAACLFFCVDCTRGFDAQSPHPETVPTNGM
jgi:MFS transporter, ACS family, glucarate transporter